MVTSSRLCSHTAEICDVSHSLEILSSNQSVLPPNWFSVQSLIPVFMLNSQETQAEMKVIEPSWCINVTKTPRPPHIQWNWIWIYSRANLFSKRSASKAVNPATHPQPIRDVEAFHRCTAGWFPGLAFFALLINYNVIIWRGRRHMSSPWGRWCQWCAPQAGPAPGRLPGWQYTMLRWSWRILPTPYPESWLRSSWELLHRAERKHHREQAAVHCWRF